MIIYRKSKCIAFIFRRVENDYCSIQRKLTSINHSTYYYVPSQRSVPDLKSPDQKRILYYLQHNKIINVSTKGNFLFLFLQQKFTVNSNLYVIKSGFLSFPTGLLFEGRETSNNIPLQIFRSLYITYLKHLDQFCQFEQQFQ